MKHELPIPRDEDDRRVLHDIAEHGCHIAGVFADETGPAFAYSVGLFHNSDHPEILIFGLKHILMQNLINGMRDSIQQGHRFLSGLQYSGIIEGFACEFRAVHPSHYRELFGYAQWLYSGSDFPVVQCIWPDSNGRFPWQADFDPKFAPLQPVCDQQAT